jgi:hypothetical protein
MTSHQRRQTKGAADEWSLAATLCRRYWSCCYKPIFWYLASTISGNIYVAANDPSLVTTLKCRH